MEHNNAGLLLQQIYDSLAPELQSQAINSTTLSPIYGYRQNNDRMIEKEMRRVKENCLRREQQYVEQMLLENPITIHRRIKNNGTVAGSSGITNANQQHSDEEVDVVSLSPPKKIQQQKRAEAYRLSRQHNNIQKAKYRHKFISQKVLESTQVFDCTQNLMEKVENHLFARGLSAEKLQHLRRSFGVDIAANKVRRWQHIMKMDK